jgi:type IV secretory pathway VirB10-like protein
MDKHIPPKNKNSFKKHEGYFLSIALLIFVPSAIFASATVFDGWQKQSEMDKLESSLPSINKKKDNDPLTIDDLKKAKEPVKEPDAVIKKETPKPPKPTPQNTDTPKQQSAELTALNKKRQEMEEANKKRELENEKRFADLEALTQRRKKFEEDSKREDEERERERQRQEEKNRILKEQREQELARKIEQEERLAEQQYNSCMSDLNSCKANAPRQVSRLGNTSAYAPALNAVVRECQRKYQCSR